MTNEKIEALAKDLSMWQAQSVQREPTPWDEVDQTSKDYYRWMARLIYTKHIKPLEDALATDGYEERWRLSQEIIEPRPGFKGEHDYEEGN